MTQDWYDYEQNDALDYDIAGDYEDDTTDWGLDDPDYGDDGYAPRPRRRPIWPWFAGGAAVLLVAIGVILWLVLRTPGNGSPTAVAATTPTPAAALTEEVSAPTAAPQEATAGPDPTVAPPSAEPHPQPALGFEVHNTYDPSGNPSSRVMPDGSATHFEYDAHNRLTGITYPDGKAVAYTYDEVSRRTSMTDWLGTTTYEYNLFGHVTAIAYPDGNTVRYQYDPDGNLVALNYPGGDVVRYEYDADGSMIGVTDASGTTTYAYDAAGRTVSRILPNGVTTDYGYDDAGHQATVTHTGPAGDLLLVFAYSFDLVGNRTQMTVTTATGEQKVTHYTYDDLSRLVGVTGPKGRKTTYTYDNSGNRLTMTTSEGTTAYTYDDANRLVSLTDPSHAETTFYYDALGNLIERRSRSSITRYTYDYENRLLCVDDGRTEVEYVYDGDGNRVKKTIDGTPIYYVNDSRGLFSQVLQEVTSAGDIQRAYTLGRDRISISSDGVDPVFYLYDSEGKSIAALADGSGTLAGAYAYDVFGQLLSTPDGFDNTFGYDAEQYDSETGLIFLRHRYYDPSLGRYLTRDAMPGVPVAPQTLNSYAFVENNPVNYIDPTGMWKLTPRARANLDVFLSNLSLASTYAGAVAFFVPGGQAAVPVFISISLGASALRISLCSDNPIRDTFTMGVQQVVGPTGASAAAGPIVDKLVEIGVNAFVDWWQSPPTASNFRYVDPHTGVLEWTPYFGWQVIAMPVYQTVLLPPSASALGDWGPPPLPDLGPRGLPDIDFDGDDGFGFPPPPPPPPGTGGVGGVSLNRAAEVLAVLDDITGATFDANTGQLILTGQEDVSLPPMSLDDLVVAIRSVYSGQDPGMTMVPADPSGQDITQWIEYFGPVRDTNFGWVMFEADRYLKGLSAGKDTLTGSPVQPSVPGFKSELQLSYEYRTETPWHRNWFVPDEVVLRPSNDGQTMIIDRATMRLESRFVEFQPDGTMIDIPGTSPVTDRFTAFVTANYDQFTAEKPELAQLKRLAKIVGVVKWLRDSDIPVDLPWIEGYKVTHVDTPTTTPGVKSEIAATDGSYAISSFGGVDLSVENTYAVDTTGQTTALRDRMVLGRPAGTPLNWTFEENGQSFQAAALSLAPTAIAGGYSAATTDLVLPSGGGVLPSLTRTHNSLNLTRGTLGPGWALLPYTFGIQERAEPTSSTHYTVVQEAALTYGTRRELFSGPYQSSAGEITLQPNSSASIFRDVLLSPDGGFVARRRDGLRIAFDPAGRLGFVEDRNGNRRTYQYDADHSTRLRSICGRLDECIQLDYDSAGRLVTALAASGLVIHYAYDDAGRLVTVSGDAGVRESYAYDGDLLIEVRDGEGRTLLHNTYDGAGRLLSQTNAAGLEIRSNHDPATGRITRTTSDGHQTAHTFQDGHLSAQVDALSHKTSFEYTPDGSLASTTDPRGHTTRYGYDDYGNPIWVEAPTGERSQTFYDVESRPVWHVTPDKRLVVFDYDAQGNLTQVTDGLQLTSLEADGSISYDPSLEATTRHEHDDAGNLVAVTGPGGHTSRLEYDNRGRLINHQLPSGNGIQRAYDEQSRPARLVDPLGNVTTLAYNDRGKLSAVSTPDGTTEYGYDARGHLTRVMNNAGNSLAYEYDALGNLVQTTEPNGAVTRYEYDGWGNLVRIVDPGGRHTVYAYDERGQLALVAHGPWPTLQLTGSLPASEPNALPRIQTMLRQAVSAVAFDQILVDLETGAALGMTAEGDTYHITAGNGVASLHTVADLGPNPTSAQLKRVLQGLAATD